MYQDRSCAITSGMEVNATFCSEPATTCDATMSLGSFKSRTAGPLESPPNDMGFTPKPCGKIIATGAVPAFTADSAVAAV